MRFVTVLNRKGGTLRTTDLDAFGAHIHETLTARGHTVDIRVVDPDDVTEAIRTAAKQDGVDVVLVGGGDGTVSSAAGLLMNSKVALAILPAGTMNLFARSLGIPQDIRAAVESFAEGILRKVDIATADDVAFVHQYSIGMHAKMVSLRDKMEFGSRLGKMVASAKAAWRTVLNPPSLKVRLTVDGRSRVVRTAGIGVSNNLFGEGHLPFADRPDGGLLGVYVTVARERRDIVRFAFNVARGRWRQNPHVDVGSGKEVTIDILSSRKRFRCVIDGELETLDETTTIRIHERALTVLVPKAAMDAGGATRSPATATG